MHDKIVDRPKIGLVLGSGGLRGLAHVGVMRVLEEEGIPIDCVAGCSIGSLIGALYCAGLSLDNIEKLARHLKRRHWLDFVIPKLGLFSGERVLSMIQILTQKKTFDQLRIPLSIVATELHEGREIVFDSGEVAAAVRASVSVPGIFIPFALDDMLLVDGAVLNPTPIDVARRMGADVVIAVDLAHAGTVCSISNIFDVIIQSIDIMERELMKTREMVCDVIIRPDIAHISPSSFEQTEECVALGAAAAREMLPQIRSQISSAAQGKAATAGNPAPLSVAAATAPPTRKCR
ncbi:MAG: patatin-like phospholipase family protein [Sporomusaceae bacterium]|nr:patatin-like phospholipase family protein [Sporomusaceae bacterium]